MDCWKCLLTQDELSWSQLGLSCIWWRVGWRLAGLGWPQLGHPAWFHISSSSRLASFILMAETRVWERELKQARFLKNLHTIIHCIFLAKERYKNSPDSTAGEIHSIIWWEELWSPLQTSWVWTVGPLVQWVYALQLLLSLIYIIYMGFPGSSAG